MDMDMVRSCGWLLLLLVVTGCQGLPQLPQSLQQVLEAHVDADGGARRSPVAVLAQQPFADSVLTIYTYDQDRQGMVESLTCTRYVEKRRLVWHSTTQGSCIGTTGHLAPLRLMTNGYAPLTDAAGAHYTYTFGRIDNPLATNVTVRLKDGAEEMVALRQQTFLAVLPTTSQIKRIIVTDERGNVVLEESY